MATADPSSTMKRMESALTWTPRAAASCGSTEANISGRQITISTAVMITAPVTSV